MSTNLTYVVMGLLDTIFATELLINEIDLDKHQFKSVTVEQIKFYFDVPKELLEYKFY